MVTFIQTTNRNAFTLRYRKYKNLRYDLWGRMALANKRNKITNYLKYFAIKDTNFRLKFLPRLKQKLIRRAFHSHKKRKFNKKRRPFRYKHKSLLGKKTGRQKSPLLKRRSAIKNLKHTFRFFYGLTFRNKSFRKFIKIKKSNPVVSLEKRIDTLLYRSNFFQTIAESRRFLYKVRILKKKGKNFSCRRNHLRPHTQIAPFEMVLMTPSLTLKRKNVLFNYILSGNKLHNSRYSYFMINFKLLVIMMIRNPLASEIKYPFCNIPLTKFLGVAKYL